MRVGPVVLGAKENVTEVVVVSSGASLRHLIPAQQAGERKGNEE